MHSGLVVSMAVDGPTYTVPVLGSIGDPPVLIVSAPAGPDGGLLAVIKGQALYGRWLSATTVFRFRATILRLAFEPLPLVYLEVPAKIESRPFRRKPRVATTLGAMFAADGRTYESLIVDLSTSGARIALADPITLEKGARVELTFRLTLLENDFLLKVPCVLTGKAGQPDSQHPGIEYYGLDFQELSQFDQLLLHGAVQERLAEGNDWLSHLLSTREA